MLRKIILSLDIEGLIIKYYHSKDVDMPICLYSGIELRRCVSNCSSGAICRKLGIESLTPNGIHERYSNVPSISHHLVVKAII